MLKKKLEVFKTPIRRKRNINDIVDKVYNKNKHVIRKCISKCDKKENKIISQNERVFPTPSMMVRGISPFCKKNITINFPSETEDMKYNVNINFENCKINMNCNCQARFMGKNSQPRSNCKHIAHIMNSILCNYYKAISPSECSQISVIDIISHLTKKYNIKLDITNTKFRTRFVKAYKKLTEYHKYPFDDKQIVSLDTEVTSLEYKKMSITFNNGECQMTSFSPITGNSTFKSKNIELMIINMIRDFVFSFGYRKHKTGKKGIDRKSNQEEEDILKMFTQLKIVE
jgi:hypothetical protein